MKANKTVLLASMVTALLLGGSPADADDDTGRDRSANPIADTAKMVQMMSPDMMESCKNMQRKHEQMVKKMEAMDGRFDELVDRMNRTRGARRTDAIAAIINEVVTQHRIMWRRHLSMQSNMQQHLREHTESMMKGMAASMAMCPMMTTVGTANGETQSTESATDDHSAHH